MKYREFGDRSSKTIILLHGGGLSWWSLQNSIDGLKDQYHIITPIIDGHGEDGDTTFVSIEDSAKKLIDYIDNEQGGKVFAIGGLSIGAQIVVEILSQRSDITEYAIIESALAYPIKGTTLLTAPTYKVLYGLINKKWFSKLQAKSLFVPDSMFEQYYKDSLKISKQSLINITLSNGNYSLKASLKNTKAKVLVIVGSKELKIMKKSADKIHQCIPDSRLHIASNMKHGELSLVHYQEYICLLKAFLINR